MSFDKPTRNLLAKIVAQCRDRLVRDITEQLQSTHGLHPDGTVLDVARTEDDLRATEDLRALWAHFEATEAGSPQERNPAAYQRLVREIGFTLLNRLAALRLCEERGLVIECVRRGTSSDGFRIYDQIADGALGNRYQTYRSFLEGLFDELALDLGIVFDRAAPQSLVFPSEPALADVLRLLNTPELAVHNLWQQDETIGWIYQYYNDPTERKALRDASNNPRNSREMAVRNQFFTPRYVVEFLTDNTLGRTWYEMRQGNTHLVEQCRYLVCRPNEIFLGPGESIRVKDKDTSNLSQDEFLRQPVHIPYRRQKDPRDLTLLDPACGSGHFMLYAFDLLTTIYEEAWADPDIPPFSETGTWLVHDYPSLEDLRIAIPGLILRHNLHGIDIDPRAVQIAALALWLRAQRAYQELGLAATERPRITKTNIVTAEPMPGDRELLEDFLRDLRPRVLADLVRLVFEQMELVGETGILLRIDKELEAAIAAAHQQWSKQSQPEQLALFSDYQYPKMEEPSLFDVSGITDATFWHTAELRVLQALREYATRVENGKGMQRRLFVDDIAQGFAFLEVSSKRYDVVLMNPPFGSSSIRGKVVSDQTYARSKADVGLAFVERAMSICKSEGTVGALTSRVLVANDSLEQWRRDLLIEGQHLRVFADLGFGVLDDALVETAAYVVNAKSSALETFFIRVLDERDKEYALRSVFMQGERSPRTFPSWRGLEIFDRMPGRVLCYWLPNQLLGRVIEADNLVEEGANARHGLQTTLDFRFLRLMWEIPYGRVGRSGFWVHFAKGGEYQPYWDDLHLSINWADDGRELKEYVSAKGERTQGSGGWSRWINSWEYYFLPGLTFPERTTSDFSPRVLPSDCIFSATGEAITFPNQDFALAYLAGAYTRQFKLLVDAFVGSGDSSVPGSAANHYRSGLVNSIPPSCTSLDQTLIERIRQAIYSVRSELALIETSRDFYSDIVCSNREDSLSTTVARVSKSRLERKLDLLSLNKDIESPVSQHLGFQTSENEILDVIIGPHPCSYASSLDETEIQKLARLWTASESQLMSVAVAEQGARRQLTKKSFYADRRLELLSHLFETSPQMIVGVLNERRLLGQELLSSVVPGFLSYLFGLAVNRWDIRIAVDPALAPGLPDPFAPLPICPPGMLLGPDGLPAAPGHIVSEAWLRARSDSISLPSDDSYAGQTTIEDEAYPIELAWDGILVDDPGLRGENPHPRDVQHRVREVLAMLWVDGHDIIEAEACEILGVRELRDYFQKPTGFFDDHLKRYSQSRRKAPIYWPLSTVSGSYTIWLYYHRLTDQTLYTAVNRYVTPKIDRVERNIAELESAQVQAVGPMVTELRDSLDAAIEFLRELREFQEELLRIAGLPYKPNLNDGVLINAAPLHRLFRLRRWAEDAQEVWRRLEQGEYDWAHLAYTLWPDRTRKACKQDRSIAIAHGLEDLFEESSTPSRDTQV